MLNCILLLVVTIILSGCGWLFPTDNPYEASYSLADYPGVEYEVNFYVDGDISVESFIKENSKLQILKSKPPISTNALRYRVLEDMKHIKRALRHKGYFDVKTSAKLKVRTSPKVVDLTVQTGPQYKVGGVSLEILDHTSNLNLTPSKFGKIIKIEPGELVDQDKIFEANVYLEKYFKNQGYPFVKVEVPDGKVNKDTKQLFVIFKVQLNHKRINGDALVTGLQTVPLIYVHNRIVWQKGDVYDDRKIERTKRKLIETELFSSVTITPIEKSEDDEVPLSIELTEAPPRSIGAGIEYTNSKGIGGRLIWAHRNLFGGGEMFTVEAKGNHSEGKGIVSYEIPDVFIPDLSFATWFSAQHNNTRAYKGQSYDAYVGFNWHTDHVRVGAGLEYERSKLRRMKIQREHYLSVPLMLLLDMRNDIINPYKGWRIFTEVTPSYGHLGESNKMLRLLVNANYYLRLIKKDTFVIGLWTRLGEINSIKNQDIPLNKRFYSGGLNSVRGYGYQKVGPIDIDSNPTGGRNLAEGGVEPRFKITDTIGVVTFIEAGSVGNSKQLTYQEKRYFVGYGVGARYYTAIGPIRFDIAFPTKRRTIKGARYDAPFQLYISIGQAF